MARTRSNGDDSLLLSSEVASTEEWGLASISNAATVTMTAQPAPVAANDTATLRANQSVTIDVLANDTSAGGTLNCASITIVVPPAHGTVAVANGEVTYTPSMGFSGLDAFQYSVQDNLGTTSNVATVSIEVTPAFSSGGGGGSLEILDLTVLLGSARVPSASDRKRHLDEVRR